MPKMVNNSNVHVPFYQEKRKMGGRANVSPILKTDLELNDDRENENTEHLRKIFVGGLSIHSTGESMSNFFSQFGVVADSVVMRDPVSNRSRGFGFVTFMAPASVEYVQRTRPHIVDGKTVETKRAFPRNQYSKVIGNPSSTKSNKIFLGGLRECHDDAALREYFAKFGNVNSVKVLLDKETGRHRGFGFLEFDDIASAARALSQSKHMIGGKSLEVKKMFDNNRRVRLPIGGAACAGYGPPQPTIVESLVYHPNYDPFHAQHSLPPSAFFNGWASYVAPHYTAPAVSHAHGHLQPQLNGYQQGGYYYGNGSHGAPKLPRNNYSSVERPKNDYKSVQAEESIKQEAPEPIDNIQVESDTTEIGVEQKWLDKDFKVFEPTGVFNRMSSINSEAATASYGV